MTDETIFTAALEKADPAELLQRYTRAIDSRDAKGRIEAELGKITGQNWKVRIETGLNGPPEQQAMPISTTPTESENGLAKARRLREEAETVPLIKRAMEVFGAQVVRVDEGFTTTAPAPAEAVKPVTEEPDEIEET
jgi:hypothetical protein